MTAEAILLSLEALFPHVQCVVADDVTERRREADRVRKAVKRGMSADFRGIPQTSAEVDEQKEKVSHTLPKEKINTTTREANFSLVQRVCEVVEGIEGPLPDNARACHDAVEDALKAGGLNVIREAEVNNGDGLTGRFDLLVGDGLEWVAIEIDFRLPRAKSTQKLLGFNGGRVQILRGSTPPQRIPGIDACLSLPITKDSGRTALTSDWEPDGKTWKLAETLGFTSQEAWDQLDRMRDWAKNADGSKGRKSDWNAAFRNWLKRAADDRRNKPKANLQRHSLAESFAVLDAVTDEAIRRAGGHGQEGGEEDFKQLPRLRKSAA